MSININEHGFWDGEFAVDHHAYDQPLSNALVEFLKKENVENMADLGCGLAHYVANFIELGDSAMSVVASSLESPPPHDVNVAAIIAIAKNFFIVVFFLV
jgi:hypothetical protein